MNRILKFFLITILCGALFFCLGEPCRLFLKLSETTEVRPVCAFPLIFGITFGFFGTFGCAVGNLISDIISGYSLPICVLGFIIQIAYGYIPVIVYKHMRRNDENKYQLDCVYKLGQYLLLIIFDSIFCAFMIFGVVHFFYGTPLFCLGFFNTFCNQLIFFIIIGIPYLCISSVIAQWRKNRKNSGNEVISISLNEKFILYFLGFSILISIMASMGAYQIFLPKHGNNPMVFWSYVYFVCAGALFFSLCPSIVFLFYMEKNISKPLERLSSTAKSFGKENDIHLEIEKILMKCRKYLYFTTEIGDLARSYTKMAQELENYVDTLSKATAEREKNATQLKIATDIQLGVLPKPVFLDEIDLYATMKPAYEVGGDFYDFFKIDDSHLAVVIADVSGKGVPAALFMMASKIILGNNLKNGLSPSEALTNANQELCENNPAEMFVTCFCGVLDLTTNIFTFANAGHEKPAIYRNGENFNLEKINSGFVLGGLPGIKYKQEELQLEKGDVIFTYTDGIPEATNSKNEEFGKERLISTLNASKNAPLETIATDILKAVSDFNDTAPQFDDITMLMFRIK